MTSPRSFREAFTEDPADVKDRARIVGERDSARRIAVALENRVELLSRLARNYHESVFEFCCAARPELTADGFTVVCSLAVEHDGGHIFAEHSPFAAALTGGGDEPEQERSEDHAGQRVCPVCCAVPVGDTVGCPCCEQWRNGIDTNGSWRVGGGDDARP